MAYSAQTITGTAAPGEEETALMYFTRLAEDSTSALNQLLHRQVEVGPLIEVYHSAEDAERKLAARADQIRIHGKKEKKKITF